MIVLPAHHLPKLFLFATVLAGANWLIELKKQHPPTPVMTLHATEATRQGAVYVPDEVQGQPFPPPQLTVSPQPRWSHINRASPSPRASAHMAPAMAAKSIAPPPIGGAAQPTTAAPVRKRRKLRRVFGVLGKAVLANFVPGGAALGNTVQTLVAEAQRSNANQPLPSAAASVGTVPAPNAQSSVPRNASKGAPGLATKCGTTPAVGASAPPTIAVPERKPRKLRRIFGALGKTVANLVPGGELRSDTPCGPAAVTEAQRSLR
jgi:hypothetical protein